jgi:hypothetical protein
MFFLRLLLLMLLLLLLLLQHLYLLPQVLNCLELRLNLGMRVLHSGVTVLSCSRSPGLTPCHSQ